MSHVGNLLMRLRPSNPSLVSDPPTLHVYANGSIQNRGLLASEELIRVHRPLRRASFAHVRGMVSGASARSSSGRGIYSALRACRCHRIGDMEFPHKMNRHASFAPGEIISSDMRYHVRNSRLLPCLIFAHGLSRFASAQPRKPSSSGNIVAVILQSQRPRTGHPEIIICDAGPNYEGTSWRQVSQLYGITSAIRLLAPHIRRGIERRNLLLKLSFLGDLSGARMACLT